MRICTVFSDNGSGQVSVITSMVCTADTPLYSGCGHLLEKFCVSDQAIDVVMVGCARENQQSCLRWVTGNLLVKNWCQSILCALLVLKVPIKTVNTIWNCGKLRLCFMVMEILSLYLFCKTDVVPRWNNRLKNALYCLLVLCLLYTIWENTSKVFFYIFRSVAPKIENNMDCILSFNFIAWNRFFINEFSPFNLGFGICI